MVGPSRWSSWLPRIVSLGAVQVIHTPQEAAGLPRGSAVSIGAYDGLHLGHRRLIARTLAEAQRLGAPGLVVTFDRHPATILRPESVPKLLTDADQKLELLAATGVDATMIVHFDQERANEAAEDFVRAVLVDAIGARSVVVGQDFHFGQGRTGTVALLRDMGADLGFEVTGVPLLVDEASDTVVSSTRIRRLLADGEVEEASRLLARPHQVRGVVARGDGRGQELGYRTANVTIPGSICLPADGVYAGWYGRPDGSRHRAALSLGRRPTFYEEADLSLLEAYLLDFDGDLYDEPAAVEFVSHLRGQARFEDVDDLIEAMARDVDATRQIL